MKNQVIAFLRRINRRIALENLKKNTELWSVISEYMKNTSSTGVSWSDFDMLYKTIRKLKPKNILELGPGASTVVMAHALQENANEGYHGKITAIEELEFYLKMSEELLPERLRPFVTYHLSPRVDYNYEIFRGVRYRDVPEIEYDFIFIDGPEHISPTDSQFTFDADFIYQLKRIKGEVSGIIDYRLSTSFVIQTLFGNEKVKFNLVKEITVIDKVTHNDLRSITLEKNTKSLLKYGKLFGNTKLKLYL